MTCWKSHPATVGFRSLGVATALLCAGMLSSAFAGEKIQFSGRNGAPVRPVVEGRQAQQFQAPDFLGATRYRKDPLENMVSTPTQGQFPSTRERDKKRKDRDDWSDRDEKETLTDRDRYDERDTDDNGRDSGRSSNRSRDERDGKDSPRKERNEKNDSNRNENGSMLATNRLEMEMNGNAPEGLMGASTRGQGTFGSAQGGAQNPFAPKAPATITFGRAQGTSSGMGGAEPLTPGNMRLETGGRAWDANILGTPSVIPNFMKPSEPVAARPVSGQPGGAPTGLMGGGFGGSFGGPGKLNDFSDISSLGGGSGQTKLPEATKPEPRFETKPAVLDIPKRKF